MDEYLQKYQYINKNFAIQREEYEKSLIQIEEDKKDIENLKATNDKYKNRVKENK